MFDPVTVAFAELISTLSGRNAPFVPDAEFDEYLMRMMARAPSAELVMVKEMWEMFRPGAGNAGAASAKRTCAELREKGFVWRRAQIRTALKEYLDD